MKKKKVAHFNWYWWCTYPLSLILIISNLKKSYTELIGRGKVREGQERGGEKKDEEEIFIKFTLLLMDLKEKNPFTVKFTGTARETLSSKQVPKEGTDPAQGNTDGGRESPQLCTSTLSHRGIENTTSPASC